MNWLHKLPRWIVWGLAFLLFVVDGWLALGVFAFFRTQLTIFLSAVLLSFVLNYPVQWLSQVQLGQFRGSSGIRVECPTSSVVL
jgi:predicted PurR-regulated permease PerM